MSKPIDTAALRAKLRVYDQTLPRCTKPIVRVTNHAPDYVAEEERAEWDMRLSYPCSDVEGHEGQCREGRAVLGWPGFATVTALLDEVERLRENADLAAERLTVLLYAERENTALRSEVARLRSEVAWLRSPILPSEPCAACGHAKFHHHDYRRGSDDHDVTKCWGSGFDRNDCGARCVRFVRFEKETS